MRSNSDDYVDCEVMFKFATKDAVLVAKDGNEHWVPRSVLSYWADKAIETYPKNFEMTIKVREWFANKVGLI